MNNLGPSQLNYYLVRNANAILLKNPTLDITTFFNTTGPAALPANFASMPMYEAWGYNGIMVATTVITAQKLQQCLAPQKRFFYVWDLEWLRPKETQLYDMWASVYRDPNMPLIARSDEHARIIEECWGRPPYGIIDDMNMQDLLAMVTV